MPKAEFDKQGKYFWHLVKTAGWTDKRVSALLLKHFGATHWNALHCDQKRAAINIMARYAAGNRDQHNKTMRSTIMAMVVRRGYDKDWLYETFGIAEGCGLSTMGYPELVTIFNKLKGVFAGGLTTENTEKQFNKE